MYVDQITSLFRTLVDEPDETYLTAADVALMAEVAHNELRDDLANSQPKLILTRQTFVMSGATSYDFADAANATVLLGSTTLKPAGAKRIHTVHRLWTLSGGRPQTYYRGCNSETQLWRDYGAQPLYYLEGTVMRFATSQNGTFELSYVPVSSVDWTRQTSGDNEFVDDFEHFHDLIALRMAEQYMVRDGEVNQVLAARLSRREDAWNFFVQSGRDKGPGEDVWLGDRNFWS